MVAVGGSDKGAVDLAGRANVDDASILVCGVAVGAAVIAVIVDGASSAVVLAAAVIVVLVVAAGVVAAVDVVNLA